MNDIKLIAGRSNYLLALSISKALNIALTDCHIIDFANSEIYVDIGETVRGYNVWFIQTGSKDEQHSVNDYFVEAIQVGDACRRSSAASIGIIYAMFPYSRSDKKDKPRVSIMSAVIAHGLENAGYSRILTMDIHAAQTQGIISIPFDNIYAKNIHITNLKNTIFSNLSHDKINETYVLVAPDTGGIKRVRAYAHKLSMSYCVMDKYRDYSKPGSMPVSILMNNGLSVSGKIAILIDDIADTMGTMIAAINDLLIHGISEVIILVTHAILSGPAIERINNCDAIKYVITTDTIDQTRHCELCPKITVVSTGQLFAEVIRRIVIHQSVSDLFE
jgi:ribose-phosphate pyrophosphokinase